MENGSAITRRETLQGMVGVAMAAILPATAGAEGLDGQTANPRPMGGPTSSGHSQPFNENWRFFHGDAAGAEAAAFDDSAWRTLDVPHDWSIEDRPASTTEAADAMWSDGVRLLCAPARSTCMRAKARPRPDGPSAAWAGIARHFPEPSCRPGGKAELRFEGVYMNCRRLG